MKIYGITDCPSMGNKETPLLLVSHVRSQGGDHEGHLVLNADYHLVLRKDGTAYIPGSALAVEELMDVPEDIEKANGYLDVSDPIIQKEILDRCRAELKTKGLLPELMPRKFLRVDEQYEFVFRLEDTAKHPTRLAYNDHKLQDGGRGFGIRASNLGEALASVAQDTPLEYVINDAGDKIPGQEFLQRCKNHVTSADVMRMMGTDEHTPMTNETRDRLIELAIATGSQVEDILHERGCGSLPELIAKNLELQPLSIIREFIEDKPVIRQISPRTRIVEELFNDDFGGRNPEESFPPVQLLKLNIRERAWIVAANDEKDCYLYCAKSGATAVRRDARLDVGMPVPNDSRTIILSEKKVMYVENEQGIELSLGIKKQRDSVNHYPTHQISFLKAHLQEGFDNNGFAHLPRYDAAWLHEAGVGRTIHKGHSTFQLLDPEMLGMVKALHHELKRELVAEMQLKPGLEPSKLIKEASTELADRKEVPEEEDWLNIPDDEELRRNEPQR